MRNTALGRLPAYFRAEVRRQARRVAFRPQGIEGERVTSTLRSPAHNKRVGGVPNSYHLRGLARDSVPPSGMTMAAYYAALKRLNPNLDVINEGDHIHLEPR